MGNESYKGRCACGDVSFAVTLERTEVCFCHCGQCRRSSGHLWGSVQAQYSDLEFETDAGLRWYASSDFAKRGFCASCGSSLFYRMNEATDIAIAAGCFDMPSGFTPGRHIFCRDKGDYYELTDDAPHIETY